MGTEKRRSFIINFLYFAIVLGIAIYLCRYALPALLPFVIAAVVALLLSPVIRFLNEKCHVHKGIASVVLVVLFYALIGFLLTILCIKLITAGKDFFITLPALFNNSIQPWLTGIFDSLEAFAYRLDPQTTVAYNMAADYVVEALGSAVSSLSKTVLSGVTSITFRTPGFLLNMLICIIATVFLAVDWSLIGRFISRQLSPKTNSLIENIRTHLGRTLGRYVRSYALIMFITFVELSIGLSIIGVNNVFLVAALISVFDILPVVGSGTVLIPWAIISVITGDYMRALGLGIVYVVVLIIRNIIEPKIIGEHVGLHPIVTLSGMVVGTYVFGPIGLLGLPVTLALIQSLNDEGVIHLYDNSGTSSRRKSGGSSESRSKARRAVKGQRKQAENQAENQADTPGAETDLKE